MVVFLFGLFISFWEGRSPASIVTRTTQYGGWRCEGCKGQISGV